MNEFLNKFADLLDDTPAENLSFDTDFRSLDEWSSLVALSLIAMADEEYEVTLSGDDIRKSNTIGDLFNAIQSKL
ncbi:MAG: acyl carrier protein [Muribaculaceae bacterium]|nr:acyl carrier protein [Muribaculaceae bacterium]